MLKLELYSPKFQLFCWPFFIYWKYYSHCECTGRHGGASADGLQHLVDPSGGRKRMGVNVWPTAVFRNIVCVSVSSPLLPFLFSQFQTDKQTHSKLTATAVLHQNTSKWWAGGSSSSNMQGGLLWHRRPLCRAVGHTGGFLYMLLQTQFPNSWHAVENGLQISYNLFPI